MRKKNERGFLEKGNGNDNGRHKRKKSYPGRMNWRRESHLRRTFETEKAPPKKIASKASS